MESMKKYGTREEVISDKAQMTKSGILKDQLCVVDGKIKTHKEIEQQQIRRDRLNEKKKEEAQSDNEPKLVKGRHSSDEDDSSLPVKAIPKGAYSLADLKDLVKQYTVDNNKTLPRGTTKWKKADWLQCATELQLI